MHRAPAEGRGRSTRSVPEEDTVKRASWILGSFFVLSWMGFLTAGNGGALPFLHDFEKGMAQAKMTGKPAVIYFTADW